MKKSSEIDNVLLGSSFFIEKKEPDLDIPQSKLVEDDEIKTLIQKMYFEPQYRNGYCEDDWYYVGYDICNLSQNKIGNAYPYHIEIGGGKGNYRLYLRLDFGWGFKGIPHVKICERRFNSKIKAKKYVVQKIFDFEKTPIVKDTIWHLLFRNRAAVVKKESRLDNNNKECEITYTWVFCIFGADTWQVMSKYKKGNETFGGEKLIDYGTYYVFRNHRWSLYNIDNWSISSRGLKDDEVPLEAKIAISDFLVKNYDNEVGILKNLDEKKKIVFIQTNKNPNDVFNQVASDLILQKS
jgi:hypothetical protein